MIPAANRLEPDWRLLKRMNQYRFLGLNISIPTEAIEFYHESFAGSSREGLSAAGYRTPFDFKQGASDNRLNMFTLKSGKSSESLYKSQSVSSLTLESLLIVKS